MIKVRATQDGTYAGYYRYGPIDSDQGYTPGEIFEVDETPQEVRDASNRPVQESEPTGELDAKSEMIMRKVWLKDSKGNILKDKHGNPMPKIKTFSWFAPEWMEKMPDDAEITNDYEPFRIPTHYRIKKVKPSARQTLRIPDGVQAEVPSVI